MFSSILINTLCSSAGDGIFNIHSKITCISTLCASQYDLDRYLINEGIVSISYIYSSSLHAHFFLKCSKLLITWLKYRTTITSLTTILIHCVQFILLNCHNYTSYLEKELIVLLRASSCLLVTEGHHKWASWLLYHVLEVHVVLKQEEQERELLPAPSIWRD